jgi:peptide/nickel transport system permease protein
MMKKWGLRFRPSGYLIIFMTLVVVIMLCARFIVPFDHEHVNMSERLEPASFHHILGTDHLGRDMFSRILMGAQTTVGTSLLVLAVSLCIGVPVGLLSGYIGGRVDRLFMRIADAFLTFPDYIAAIILSGLLGPGIVNLVFAIVVVKWVGYARLARSTVLGEKQKEYIILAKLNGLSSLAILRKHMLPHVAGNVMVLAAMDMGKIILMIASLSYIGLGAQPPTPEWGAMLNEGRAYFYHAPHLMIIPGVAIMIVVLLSNLLGDFLRDRFDVKQEKEEAA